MTAGLEAMLDELVPHVLRVTGTPGMALAIARGGEVVLERGYGLADVASGRPMTPETVTHAGSMSKLYTAVAVLQLVEAGRLALDEPVSSYVDFPIENPFGERPITVRDLMQHTSGLTPDAAGCDVAEYVPLGELIRDGYARETFDDYGGTLPRWSAKVGQRWQYSNFGISTLGYLVELTNPDGLSHADYVRTRILDPLAMASSDFPPRWLPGDVRGDLLERCSTGYAGYGELVLPTLPVYISSYPAGALLTTPGDHIKLLLALARGGSPLLSRESVEAMLAPAVPMDEGEGGFTGLVAKLFRVGELEEAFGHWGAIMWGWWNASAAFPRLDLAIVACCNRWDMIRYTDLLGSNAPTLVVDLVSGFVAREQRGLPGSPERSWEWKSSYAMGVSLAERTVGVLGVRSPLTPELIDPMAEAAPDADGFRAGIADLLPEPHTPAGAAAFLASDRVAVPPAELALINAELGGRGPFALPSEDELVGMKEPS
ncbi:MAG TPA: serine hydrolase domain-containing protein [Gaiellaceae bacterium]